MPIELKHDIMLRVHVVPDEFLLWVKTCNDRPVGTRKSAALCPISKYVANKLPWGYTVLTSGGSTHIYPPNTDTRDVIRSSFIGFVERAVDNQLCWHTTDPYSTPTEVGSVELERIVEEYCYSISGKFWATNNDTIPSTPSSETQKPGV